MELGGRITCCKDCQKRFVGCHSSCKEYLEQKAKWDKMNENRKRFNDEQTDFLRVRNNRRNKRNK